MGNKLVITAYFTTLIVKIIIGLEKPFQRTPDINDSPVSIDVKIVSVDVNVKFPCLHTTFLKAK